MAEQLSSSQLRAARALLNWTRAKLAELSCVSEPTIHRMETDAVQPHAKSIESIIKTFDENGVEFTDDGGVRPKQQSVDVFVGLKGYQQFFDGVYEYSRKYGGKIVQCGIDENQFVYTANGGNFEYAKAYNKRMTALVKERGDITVLAIVREGDTNLVFNDYNEYRWMSKDRFVALPFYVYGDVMAIMDYNTVPSPTIIAHKHPAIARAYRKQFDIFWKMSRKPDLSEKEIKKPF